MFWILLIDFDACTTVFEDDVTPARDDNADTTQRCGGLADDRPFPDWLLGLWVFKKFVLGSIDQYASRRVSSGLSVMLEGLKDLSRRGM